MSALVLVDAEIIAGPLRVSGISNEVKLELEADALDSTVWTSGGWRSYQGGLRKAMLEANGFFDTAPAEAGALTPDAELFAELGTQFPCIVSPTSADLSVAYILTGQRSTLDFLGKIGDLAPFASAISGSGQVARGLLAHPATVLRTTGSGTGSQAILGTVPAGKSLLVALNVLTVGGGGTVQVGVQRGTSGFPSPVTIANLGPVSVPTAALVVVPGPITPDDRYRVTWTVSGVGATGRFAAAVGITN